MSTATLGPAQDISQCGSRIRATASFTDSRSSSPVSLSIPVAELSMGARAVNRNCSARACATATRAQVAVSEAVPRRAAPQHWERCSWPTGYPSSSARAKTCPCRSRAQLMMSVSRRQQSGQLLCPGDRARPQPAGPCAEVTQTPARGWILTERRCRESTSRLAHARRTMVAACGDCGRYLFPPSGHLAVVGCRTRSHPL